MIQIAPGNAATTFFQPYLVVNKAIGRLRKSSDPDNTNTRGAKLSLLRIDCDGGSGDHVALMTCTVAGGRSERPPFPGHSTTREHGAVQVQLKDALNGHRNILRCKQWQVGNLRPSEFAYPPETHWYCRDRQSRDRYHRPDRTGRITMESSYQLPPLVLHSEFN